MRHLLTVLIFIVSATHPVSAQQSDMPDKEQLAIALDYFSGGKYREALNILSRLDKKYKLNPRFKAYIGLCYYYEWNYSMACTYIDPYIEALAVYAPHERSIYYFTAAESHFFLGEYDKAVPLYEKMLTVCYNKEKGDALFRIAFCNMEDKKWESALENLNSALLYYEQFGYPQKKQARIIQIQKMIKGCEKELKVHK